MQSSIFYIAFSFPSVGAREVKGAGTAHVKFLCHADATMRNPGSISLDGKSLHAGIVAGRCARQAAGWNWSE